MKNVQSIPLIVALLGSLVGCGHYDAPMDKQTDQRNALMESMQGDWQSHCRAGVTKHVNFAGDKITVSRTNYFDPECKEVRTTVQQTGTTRFANTYKEGVLDTISVDAADQISVTLASDFDVDRENDRLAHFHNDAKELVIGTTATPEQNKQITRENLKTQETRKVANWVHGQAQVLNHLQYEKLTSLGLKADALTSLEEVTTLKYETDNSVLQLSGAGIGEVYFRQ